MEPPPVQAPGEAEAGEGPLLRSQLEELKLTLSDAPLARHSAPMVPAETSGPEPPPVATDTPGPILRSGSAGGAPVAASPPPSGAASAFGLRPPHAASPAGPLSVSADLARRMRGLLASAVNFRDVELVPPSVSLSLSMHSEGDPSGLGELDEGEETDADAATGAAAPPPPTLMTAHSAGASGGGGTSGGGGAWAPAGVSSGPGGFVRVGSAGSIGSAGSSYGGGAGGGEGYGPVPGVPGVTRSRTGATIRKNKLVIIMVGLPGRGKTFLCNMLCRYLSWLGHATRHFNVGQYRRLQRREDEVQDAEFFDHSNEAGVVARNRAFESAIYDMEAWLLSDASQVAVFDATNTTQERRNILRTKLHGKWQYLFIESICSDPAVLETNYRHKMQYSPDYEGVDIDQAVADFLARIAKYEEVYEPIADRTMHYIKLIDMVTGRGHMDINRISGYLPGKIVFFLMQVCKAGLTSARKIWLTRHGESEYNQRGLIGGNSSLSERGQRYAAMLPEALLERLPQDGDKPVSVAVWTSTLKRTIETARALPFPKLRWKALDEINAGICDGLTYEQIEERHPAEAAARKVDKLRYRYPSGESYMDVIQRVEPVIIELEREREYVVVVAHQAILRALYAYFMGVPLEEVPRLAMPLHTLIELTPMPDGTMHEKRFPVDVDAGVRPGPVEAVMELAAAGAVPAGLAHCGSGVSAVADALAPSPQSSLGGGAGGCSDAGGLAAVPEAPAGGGEVQSAAV